jgi:hypothetical protein
MATIVVILCLGFIFLVPSTSFAYLDPGSGSMLLQLILGGVAGLVVVFKLYWGQLLTFLGIRKKTDDLDKTSDS